QEGLDLVVHLRDAVQVRLRHLHRAQLARVDLRGHLGRGHPDHVGHCSSPRIRGTRKRPSSAAGAPESACSCVSPGRTSSSRNTLVSGTACDVGGTTSVATSLTLATASRMTSSCPANRSRSSSVTAHTASLVRRATVLTEQTYRRRHA